MADLEETIRQLKDPRKREAYRVGELAFMYKAIVLLIKQLEQLKPSCKQEILLELEAFAKEVQGLPFLLKDLDSRAICLAVETYLENLRKELSD